MHAAERRHSVEPWALLRLHEVENRTGLRKTALYALIARREFPAAIALTARARRWDSRAVDGWIADRIKQAQGKVSSAAAHLSAEREVTA